VEGLTQGSGQSVLSGAHRFHEDFRQDLTWLGVAKQQPVAVVVDDFDILRSSGGPSETNPPLIVCPDAVLPGPIALARLETITGRHSQIVQVTRWNQQTKFLQSHILDNGRQPPASFAAPCLRTLRVPKADDHQMTLCILSQGIGPAEGHRKL